MSPLSQQEGIFRVMFETSTEGLLVANKEGVIELTNRRAAEMFGYSEAEFIGMNVDQLLPTHLRDRHSGYRHSYSDNPRKRPMGQGYDLIGVRKDGSSVPIEISLNYHHDGETMRIIALIMDVTVRKEQEAEIKMLNKSLEKRVEQRTQELRESQRLYSLIARKFPNGTINVFDRDYKYIFVEGEELYKHGITSARLMGKNYLDQLPEAVRPEMKNHLQAVLAGENMTFEVQYLQQHYLINAVALTDDKGEINRILLVEQNITSRKEAEEKVRDALEKERQLNELKSRFVSMASHEFRTPLSTVLSSLSLIEKYDEIGEQEKKVKHFKRIRGSVRHLTSILNDFLSLEKVETGKVSVNLAEFNLRDLLNELVEQQQEITKNGQIIELEYKGIDRFVSDQHMMRIIMSNLLSNAIKYSFEEQRINVVANLDEERLVLTVRDYGIGIPPEEQENMFERFFRARNAVNLEGTGLGLNIVRRYLQLLSGDITFESAPNEGTTFTIEIPNHPLS